MKEFLLSEQLEAAMQDPQLRQYIEERTAMFGRMRANFDIKVPRNQSQRNDKIPDVCLMRESAPYQFDGRTIGGVRFGPAVRKMQGRSVPIDANGVEVAVGILDFRGDGLYLKNITPTPTGAEGAKNPVGTPVRAARDPA